MKEAAHYLQSTFTKWFPLIYHGYRDFDLQDIKKWLAEHSEPIYWAYEKNKATSKVCI